jgi:hypothetical protein
MSQNGAGLYEVVYGPQDELVRWVCERIGLEVTKEARAIGQVKNGRLVGGVVFDGWTGTSVVMHVASEGRRWITRKLLRAVFGYVFAHCKVAIGIVPSGNMDALRFDHHLGFEKVAEIKDAHPDGSLIILAMRKENCKWI